MMTTLALELIDADPEQPRTYFDQDTIDELARSLAEHGLAQPIVVRPVDGRYRIVCGERRYRAARQLGWPEMQAQVREMTADEALRLALVENIQRDDLSAVEEAHAFRRLIDGGMSQAAVGALIGRSQQAVADRLALLKLPDDVQTLVTARAVTPSIARRLVTIDDPAEQIRLAREAAGGALTVKDLEEIRQRLKREAPAAYDRVSQGDQTLAEVCREQLVAFERDRLGLVDASVAEYENAYPFRWRLSRYAMQVAPNVNSDELMMIWAALDRWRPTLGDTDAFKWWIADWYEEAYAWDERCRSVSRYAKQGFRLSKRADMTDEKWDAWVAGLPEKVRPVVLAVLDHAVDAHRHYPGGISQHVAHIQEYRDALCNQYRDLLVESSRPGGEDRWRIGSMTGAESQVMRKHKWSAAARGNAAGGRSWSERPIDERDIKPWELVAHLVDRARGEIIVVPAWLYRDLVACGDGEKQAETFIALLSGDAGTPIGVSIESDAGEGATTFIAAEPWTEERIGEWVDAQLAARKEQGAEQAALSTA